MDVAEVRERSAELAAEIARLVREFEKESGTSVRQVEVSHAKLAGEVPLVAVTVSVEL